MASDAILELTDENFETEVLKSDQPVLVDFWAEWCMPCKMLAPTIDALAEEFEGKAKVGKVNTDNSRETALRYKINAIPTIILFHEGEAAKQFVGLAKKEELASALSELVGA